MRAPLPGPMLFAEVIESVTTADEPFEDRDGSFGTKIVKPRGKGWRIADYTPDRKTKWMRRRPIPWSPQMVSGRWRKR